LWENQEIRINMTKNMTRKGLAFGAGIALVASGLASVPAQAAVTGAVTLVPTQGTTYNSIQHAGITLQSQMDETSIAPGEDANLVFLIENAGAEELIIGIDGSFNGTFSAQTNVASLVSGTAFTNGSPNLAGTTSGLTSSAKFIAVGSVSSTFAAPVALSINTSERALNVTLNVTAFVDSDRDGFIDTFERVSPTRTVILYAVQNVSATVALSDLNVGSDDLKSTVIFGQDVNPYMVKSRTGVRILKNGVNVEPGFDANNTTDLFPVDINSAPAAGTPGVAKNTLVAGVVASTGAFQADVNEVQTVNEFIVTTGAASLTLPNGDVLSYTAGDADTDADVQAGFQADTDYDAAYAVVTTAAGAVNATNGTGTVDIIVTFQVPGDQIDVVPVSVGDNGTIVNTTPGNEGNLAADAGAGIYSALAFFDTKGSVNLNSATDLVQMGAPSSISDLTVGGNADVDKLTLDVTDTANYKETVTGDREITVRAGTTSVTFGVQARDATVVLKAANIDVRAIVTEVALDAAAEISISGSTGKLVDGGAEIIAYGVTDSNGQASFTVTSKNGKKEDHINVVLQFKTSAGVWTTINSQADGGVDGGLDIQWFATAFSAFTPKPAAFVSGANPVVTFEVTDQWSQPVSFIDDTRLSVYASAYVGGVETTTKYAERVTVVDGLAAFTFANFAATGATAELRAILYKGATSTVGSMSTVTVYNTAATSAITVANNFKTDITYNDYVTGSSTDVTVAAALVATGLGADTVRATIAGNVNNATGSGQPGAAVTLSADGVLFFDAAAKVYALDTITTTSNEFGAWTVFAYSHTVNTKGATVSITSGTVTKSTLLITHLPKDILDRNNLVFSFDVPATLVMNTTYVVIAKLADKWGNPIQTAGTTGSVSVVGNGSVQVNGVTNPTVKDFNAKGEATVFIRSIKDIAGPSSVTATLLTVTSQYAIDPALNGGAGGALGLDSFGSLLSTTVDVTGTAWDETSFQKTIEAERDVVTTAPAASSDTIVNVGTFSGKLVVYALNAAGSEVSYKIAGKWVTQVVTSDLLQRYDRVVGATGRSIKVDIYVDGVLKVSKSVVTK
jgi:hypothetical protein